jgi:lysophospholipase L1-like esterase
MIAMLGFTSSFALSADGTVFRVVVLGSSTAAGEVARPLDSSWVNKYKQYLGSVFQTHEVINLAVGGFTTFNVMPNGYVRPSPYDTSAALAVKPNNNITKALSLNPSLILVNMPTNDSYLNIPVSQQLANFDVLVNAALNANVPIYLSTSQPRNVNTNVQNMLIDLKNQMLTRYAGRLMDFWTGLANANGTINYLYDGDGGTHLNNAGHTLLFQRAVEAVQLPLPVTTSPKLLAFGNHTKNVGTALDITVSNPTSSNLTFDNIYTGTSVFVSNLSNASALPGGSFIVQVTFTPPAIGAYDDTLYLHNNSSLVMVKIPLSGSALAPAVQAAPTALAYGGVNRIAGATLRLALRNSDINAGSVTSITSQSGQFTATPSTGTIPQGDSLVLDVKFSPAGFGSVSDTLRLYGVVSGGVVKVPVSGNSPVPTLTPSSTSLDFGDVSLAVPKTVDLTLSNGAANELIIDALANSNPAFFIDPASATIPPNGSIVAHITFAPSGFGTAMDTLQVISNAAGSPLRVPLRGRVPTSSLTLSRTSIVFPMIGMGDAVLRYLYLRNEGISPITVSSISGHSVHFAAATSLPLNVSAHDSVLVGIRFSPQAPGDLRDTMAVVTNANTAELIVSGSSPTSYLRSTQAPVAFGSVKTGTTIGKSCVLRVQSADPGFTIAVDSVRVAGSMFAVSGFAGRTLLIPADSLQVLVLFSPTQLITYAETLLVFNDSYLNVLRVPLAGKGDTFTDLAPSTGSQPLVFALEQNYPNPFNPSTEIAFILEQAGIVSLRVYDLLGREIAVLQDGWQDAGIHQVRFNAAGLPSGMYVYQLRAGGQAAVRRMLLMK